MLCGAGALLEALSKLSYRVEGIVPSKLLLNRCKEKKVLSNVEIHLCKFQEFETNKKYDLVIFSESFQYIPFETAINKALSRLNPGGHILICDFFNNDNDAVKTFKLGGGHNWIKWQKFKDTLTPHLALIREEDITERVSTTVDLYNGLTINCIKPSFYLLLDMLASKRPYLSKILRWKFRKRIAKIEDKYFHGQRTGKNFEKYKKYMLYLLKKRTG